MPKYFRPEIQQQQKDILNRMYGFRRASNVVYALVQNIERKRSPIYVGETADPRRRFEQHLKVGYGGREDSSPVGKLERHIIGSGGKLEMYCLGVCQNRISALSMEATWARALSSSGCILMNAWPEHLPGSNVFKVPIERIKLLNLTETLALGIKLKLKCDHCALQIDLPAEQLKGLGIGHPSVASIEVKLACPTCGDGCYIDLSLPVALEACRLIEINSVNPDEFLCSLQNN